jgi:hypothetical protein
MKGGVVGWWLRGVIKAAMVEVNKRSCMMRLKKREARR